MAGPMVVTQWINTQYYFATVDNDGNLMTGLPLQSLKSADDEPYHQPLRLSTVIEAPVQRVTEILVEHEDVRELLDNNWLSLTVVDPRRDHRAFHYESNLNWTPLADKTAESPEPVAAAVADD